MVDGICQCIRAEKNARANERNNPLVVASTEQPIHQIQTTQHIEDGGKIDRRIIYERMSIYVLTGEIRNNCRQQKKWHDGYGCPTEVSIEMPVIFCL